MGNPSQFNFRPPERKRNGHKAKLPSDMALPPLPAGLKAKCLACSGQGRTCSRCKSDPGKHVHMPVVCRACRGSGAEWKEKKP